MKPIMLVPIQTYPDGHTANLAHQAAAKARFRRSSVPLFGQRKSDVSQEPKETL